MLRMLMTLLFPICIIRSLVPLPSIRITASCISTSENFKLHNSDILMPVENNVSQIAISRSVRLLRYVVEAREYCLYIVDNNFSTVCKGIVLGSRSGSLNFVLILLNGFVSIIYLYSKKLKKAFNEASFLLAVFGLKFLCRYFM